MIRVPTLVIRVPTLVSRVPTLVEDIFQVVPKPSPVEWDFSNASQSEVSIGGNMGENNENEILGRPVRLEEGGTRLGKIWKNEIHQFGQRGGNRGATIGGSECHYR